MSTTSCTSVGTRGQLGIVFLHHTHQTISVVCNSPQGIVTMTGGQVETVRHNMKVDGGSTVATTAI